MSSIAAANLFSVTGMIFVITGGGSGLGEMTALGFDANGAKRVYILGRREDSLKKVAAKAVNNTIVPVVCDITDRSSLEAAVKRIESESSFVNVVIANSGTAGPGTGMIPFEKTGKPPANLSELQAHLWSQPESKNSSPLEVNILGTYNTFLAFVGLLDAGNSHPESVSKDKIIWSQFITLSSDSSFIRQPMVDYPYAASKAGINHLSKQLATEFAKYNIRVNSVAPGLFPSEATAALNFYDKEDPSVFGGVSAPDRLMQRAGGIEDMAGVMLYLTSRAGAYCNGIVILVDGGYTAGLPASY